MVSQKKKTFEFVKIDPKELMITFWVTKMGSKTKKAFSVLKKMMFQLSNALSVILINYFQNFWAYAVAPPQGTWDFTPLFCISSNMSHFRTKVDSAWFELHASKSFKNVSFSQKRNQGYHLFFQICLNFTKKWTWLHLNCRFRRASKK